MSIHFTQSFQDQAAKACKKDARLKKALSKQFSLFQKNYRHPSLRLHKLQGRRTEQYAIWIHNDLRALCVRDNDDFIFFELITHDQY